MPPSTASALNRQSQDPPLSPSQNPKANLSFSSSNRDIRNPGATTLHHLGHWPPPLLPPPGVGPNPHDNPPQFVSHPKQRQAQILVACTMSTLRARCTTITLDSVSARDPGDRAPVWSADGAGRTRRSRTQPEREVPETQRASTGGDDGGGGGAE